MGTHGESAPDRRGDGFVSHASQGQTWAEWVAWQVMQTGRSVELAIWDWAPGEDFAMRMQAALHHADRVLAIWSAAYFQSAFGSAELRAAFARQVGEAGPRLVPVLVERVAVPELYASLIYVDLVGLDESTAAEQLRARLDTQRPVEPPRFPVAAASSGEKPAFGGALPVWNVPPRNVHFVGRAQVLMDLRDRLRSGDQVL